MCLHLSEADRAFINGLASKIATEFCAVNGLPETAAAELGVTINDAVTTCVETKIGIIRERRVLLRAGLDEQFAGAAAARRAFRKHFG